MTRQAFRTMIDGELDGMGWPSSSRIWAPRSSNLIIVIGGRPWLFELRSNMGKVKLSRVLGRLEGLALVLHKGAA